jgi:RNA-directed DNA polymerase
VPSRATSPPGELPANRFVLRTDVKSYYASIDHFKALDLLAEYIDDKAVLNLLCQTLRRSTTRGGLYRDYQQGISRGCPLSPLIGAFFLQALDRRMELLGLFYVRFMDDILVLAPTRWKLRTAVRLVNQELAELMLDKHPDKTFIGRIDKGFDFLGYHVRPDGLSVAQATLDRCMERATRLYEQEKGKPEGFPVLGLYMARWMRWARSGHGSVEHPGGYPLTGTDAADRVAA